MERTRTNKIIDNRTEKTNRAIVTVATGEYNQYVNKLVTSAQKFFGCHVYLFTDTPDEYKDHNNITIIETPHLGWPHMPLLRFELLNRYQDIFKESYLFLVDADTEFVKNISQGVLSHRVGVLHRNIMRYRDEFNYEKRRESMAYVAPYEGEKYFACGFCGGLRQEFIRMCEVISDNIRHDIRNGIRAMWGDESHLNRYFIDNRPTLVLPPSYMCPETNPHFKAFIKHQSKDFKKVNKEDTEQFLSVNPKEYEDYYNRI